MPEMQVSRRRFFGLGTSAAVLAGMPAGLSIATGQAKAQQTTCGLLGGFEALADSVNNAVSFAYRMMDAYASGSTVRLSQSYSDGGLQATGFTYDNAVLIHALLASEDPDNLPRAEVLGRGLLHAQATNFPIADGRFAQAYFVNAPDKSGAYISPAAYPFYFYSSAVGDQAWAGMALAQLYARTKNRSYLAGALKVGNWIVRNAYSTKGSGGYSFGTTINPSNQSVPSTNGKSTEHNIDTYAFFTMLKKLTDDGDAENGRTWGSLAEHAIVFLRSMFNPNGPYFFTGTLGDQISINYYPVPEDCQTWSFMSLEGSNIDLPTHKNTIDWALSHLKATDRASAPHSQVPAGETFSGLVFDTASLNTTSDDPDAVWLEGTAHAAAALAARILQGRDGFAMLISDVQKALELLQDCQHAQQLLGAGQTVNGKPIPAGTGLVAATSTMDTGFGYTYGNALHIGATGWFLLAGYAGNPFRLGYRLIA